MKAFNNEYPGNSNLEIIIEEHLFLASKMYSMDETGSWYNNWQKDNYYIHIFLKALKFRINFLVLLFISPHIAHRVRPLDVAFYGPLKTAFRKECDLFLKSHALWKITPYDVALFEKVFWNMAAIQKEVAGFRASGIMPIHSSVFKKKIF